ncbi:DUF3352 domain-containing protein [bacterium]|nr:DUF3352 domain-containing protein [bacterium]
MSMPIRFVLLIIGTLYVTAAWGQEVQFDRIVPSDVIFYMEGDESQDAQQAFPHFNEAMGQLAETMDDVLEWRVVMDEWEAVAKAANIGGLEGVFGDRWCLAITGFGEQYNRIPSLIYMADVQDEDNARTCFQQAFKGASNILPVVEVEEDNYDGLPIVSLFGPGRIPGLSLSFTVFDGRLILTSSKPLVIDLIEKIDYPDDALADNKLYQEFTARLPEKHSMLSYLPVANMIDGVSNIVHTAKGFASIGSKENDDAQWMQSVFGGIEAGLDFARAVRVNGLSSINGEDGFQRTTSVIELDPDKLDPFLAELFNREKATFPLEDYIPRQTGSFAYTNIFNLKDLWVIVNDTLAKLPQGAEMKKTITDFMDGVGLDIERDLLSWMGDTFCLVRPLADLNAVAPANHFAVIIDAADEARLRQSLKTIEDAFVKTMLQFKIPIGVNEETHSGVKITSIGSELPFIPVSPSWCIDEGRFILSSDVNFIREMIDVRNGRRPSIAKNRDYQALQDKVLQPAHKVAFQDVASEFYTTRESMLRITSITQLANGSNNEEKELAEAVIDRVAYLLGCLQIYRASAKQTMFSDEEIRTEKWLLSRDLRATPSAANIKRRPVSIGLEELIFNWAKNCAKRGDDERAARLYQNLLKQHPAHRDYLTGLASVYQDQGNPQAAEEAYDMALEVSPTVSLLLAREAALGESDASVVQKRIQAFTQDYPQIDPAAALFGAALAMRDADKTDEAKALFALSAASGNAQFAQAAHQEIAIMNDPQAAAAPLMATKDDLANAASIAVNGSANGKALLAQTDEGLYVALQVPKAELTSEEVEFRISLSPARDYASRADYSVMLHNSNGEWSILRKATDRTADDPYDFKLNDAKPAQGNDLLKTFQSIMKDITDQDFDFFKELQGKQEKNDDVKDQQRLAWKASLEQGGDMVTLEAEISLDSIRAEFDVKPVMMIQAAVGVEKSAGNDYLNYVPLRSR